MVALASPPVSGTFERSGGYLPIEAYALIGDCRSAALLGSDGSIDWLCLPRFDDASLFGRILDARRGGHWQVCPAGEYSVVQRYHNRTNVLATVFSTATGSAVVTDFMPIDAETIDHHARPHPRAPCRAHHRMPHGHRCDAPPVQACARLRRRTRPLPG